MANESKRKLDGAAVQGYVEQIKTDLGRDLVRLSNRNGINSSRYPHWIPEFQRAVDIVLTQYLGQTVPRNGDTE